MKFPYDDILHLPRPVSRTHPPMDRQSRAAQFSPFAALTGYDDAIAEEGRLTGRRLELSEDQRRALDETQRRLTAMLPLHPAVTVTYFVPDERKSGGSYETVTKPIRHIDEAARTFHMTDGQVIDMDRIVSLNLPDPEV